MDIRSAKEALLVACQMETEAVQTYRRAMQLMDQLGRRQEALYGHLCAILRDEESHLARFRTLAEELPEEVSQERLLTLGAMQQGTLFENGLMGAARQGFLEDVPGMLRYAAQSEALSVERYQAFAQLAQTPDAREALLQIAAEEARHLSELEALEK